MDTRYQALSYFSLETLGVKSPIDAYKGDFLPMAVERMDGDIDQVVAKWDDDCKRYVIHIDFNATAGMIVKLLNVYVDGRKKEYKRDKKQKE